MSSAGSNLTQAGTGSGTDSASDRNANASWVSPGAGITHGYDGNSITMKIFIVLFCGLAIYNSVELIFMCLMTFTRHRGLYFWSLLCASIGIIPYSLGFMLKFMNWTTGNLRWLAVFFLTIGWYPMITGESLVLWSRLHLIVSGERGEQIIFWTKWMIIIDAIILHIPTTVVTFGANGTVDTATFARAYNVIEKIQMIGFFLQEVVLSSIYIVETAKILRTSLQARTRSTMRQLIGINIAIIVMDLGLLGLECASLYILETLVKGVVYSVKLKLEFAILGRLVKFVGGSQGKEDGFEGPRQTSVGFVTTKKDSYRKKATDPLDEELDVADFVDLNRVNTDVTHASLHTDSENTRRRSCRPNHRGTDLDYNMARFQHVEDVSRLKTEESRKHEDALKAEDACKTEDSDRTLGPDDSDVSFGPKTADWALGLV